MDTAVFEEYAIVPWSKRGVYLVSHDQQLPTKPELDAPGLFFMRAGSRYPKMTTAAAMLLGHHATQNRIELTAEQAKVYLQRQTITVSDTQAANCTSTGFVICCYQGYPLGQGIFHAKSNQVESLFPQSMVSPGGAAMKFAVSSSYEHACKICRTSLNNMIMSQTKAAKTNTMVAI